MGGKFRATGYLVLHTGLLRARAPGITVLGPCNEASFLGVKQLGGEEREKDT